MTYKEIEEEIRRLERLRREMEKREIAQNKEQARVHVGRCFVVDGVYVKVLGIPLEETLRSGRFVYNPYQYPAIFLNPESKDDVIPFYCDTLFSKAWNPGVISPYETVEEISPEQFNGEFKRRLRELWGMVTNK